MNWTIYLTVAGILALTVTIWGGWQQWSEDDIVNGVLFAAIWPATLSFLIAWVAIVLIVSPLMVVYAIALGAGERYRNRQVK